MAARGASPVYFAHRGDDFIWVSQRERLHSRNIAARPQVGLVVFDSGQPAGTGLGVYAQAEARELLLDEADDAVRVFSDRSVAYGGGTWDGERLVSTGLRLCCAVPSELSLLPGEGTADRVEVPRA